MGEPTKVILLEKAIEVIKRDNLLKNVRNIGEELQKGLRDLEVIEIFTFIVNVVYSRIIWKIASLKFLIHYYYVFLLCCSNLTTFLVVDNEAPEVSSA